ncbi:MAG: hypothetical protein MUF50_04310 [Planctomycetes bacterium]|nr:hypothetical protein [Planctomycetota bacterium]
MTREEIIFFFRNFKIEVNGKVITFSIEEIKKMNLAPFLEKSNFSQEIIKERFKTNIEKLKIDPEIWKNCCLKKPRLFLHLPETINNKIQDLYLLLGIKRETLLEMIIKKPSILLFKPEKITYNVEAISKILGIAKDDFIVSAIKKPNLLTYSVKSASKIAVIAEMLKVEKQMVVKASCKLCRRRLWHRK